MNILVDKPRQIPLNPSSFTRLPITLPEESLPTLCELFSLETIVSAGCDITAQKIPAQYPATKVTPNCCSLLYSDLGFRQDARINCFNGAFESSKFHHCIRNLT